MVKYTQTVRREQPTNCLSVFDHFVKLAFKGLMGPQYYFYFMFTQRFMHIQMFARLCLTLKTYFETFFSSIFHQYLESLRLLGFFFLFLISKYLILTVP